MNEVYSNLHPWKYINFPLQSLVFIVFVISDEGNEKKIANYSRIRNVTEMARNVKRNQQTIDIRK